MTDKSRAEKFDEYLTEHDLEDEPFRILAEGRPVREIAERFKGFIPDEPDFPSRSWIYMWVGAGGDERRRKWDRAKEIASHSILEDVDEEIWDANPMSGAEVSHLRLKAARAEARAKAFNPDVYGDRPPETNVNLNVGQLHLDALKAHGSMAEPDQQVEGAVERRMLEAEVVEEGG